MRETGERAGKLELFVPKVLLMEKVPLYSAWLEGFYSQTPFTNDQNNKANTITMGAKKEESQKGNKRSQKVKGAGSQQCMMNSAAG